MVQHIWFKVAPYWHIGIAVIWGCIVCAWWVHDVSGYGGRIDALENTQSEQKVSIAVINENVQQTKEQVHDIWQYMRLDRVKK